MKLGLANNEERANHRNGYRDRRRETRVRAGGQYTGVSTRLVDELIKAMGMSGISKSQVSRLCAKIDKHVEAFLSAPS